MFSTLHTELNTLFSHFNIGLMSGWILALKGLLVAYFTMLIIYRAIQIGKGTTQTPIRYFFYEMVLWAIVLSVALNHSGWWARIDGSIEAIHSWAGGGVNLYAQMDNLVDKVNRLAEGLFEKDPATIFVFKGAAAYALVWIGFIIAAMSITFILIGTTFALKLLILVAPLAIVSILFGWFKQTFQNWLVLLLSNTITVLLIGIVVKVVATILDAYILKLNVDNAEKIVQSGLMLFVFGLFVAFITKNVLNLASGMAGGGIDSFATRATESMAGAAKHHTQKAVGLAGGKALSGAKYAGGKTLSGAKYLGGKARSIMRGGKK
jgi:type IV secretion system protein VirB6